MFDKQCFASTNFDSTKNLVGSTVQLAIEMKSVRLLVFRMCVMFLVVVHTYMLRCTSLVVLTLQNALLILVMRYARTRTGDMFFSSTAVVAAEFFKVIGCLVVITWEEGSVQGLWHNLNQVCTESW